MLEIINTYVHGFVAVPMTAAARRHGLLAALEGAVVDVDALCFERRGNSGYFRILMRTLHALGWVKSDDHRHYEAAAGFHLADRFDADVSGVMDIDYQAFLFQGEGVEGLRPYLEQAILNQNRHDDFVVRLFDGPFVVQLFLALAVHNPEHCPEFFEQTLFERLHRHARSLIRQFFEAKGLCLHDAQPLVLTDLGRYLVERALTMGVTGSYLPMLRQIDELLLGDVGKVLGRDADGHETYVERTLNVLGSGFQHDKFFKDILSVLQPVFNDPKLEAQPKFVVDMGCGDGSLLRIIYTAIAENTLRGKHLDEFPLTMVGVDYNQKSLDSTAKTLTAAGVPNQLLWGDIGRPDRLADDLAERGIENKDDILHVRSFLDHDRPLNLTASDGPTACSDDVYIGRDGRAVAAEVVWQDLDNHLGNWSKIVGRHGILLLEVFSLPVDITGRFFGETESFSFDIYHTMSRQALLPADAFKRSLAGAGLFAESQIAYPKTLPFTRIAAQYLKPADFRIRTMVIDDVPKLLDIDKACWPEALRLSQDEIFKRHHQFPDGQLVMEYQGEAVGILYTQRIKDINEMTGYRYRDFSDLHDPKGRYFQLLSISVDPKYQSLSLGDSLLEFGLDLAAAMAGVEAIVGVTRCLNFKDQTLGFADYVAAKDERGNCLDPLLRFHQMHGAAIERVVEGIREEDLDNQGHGILIRYRVLDRKNRVSRDQQAKSAQDGSNESIADIVAREIRTVMPQGQSFEPDAPLKSLGLDSMGLMELRVLLNGEFGLGLDPSFFYTYATCEAIAGFIEKSRSAEQVHALVSAPKLKTQPDVAEDPHGQWQDVAIVGCAYQFAKGIDDDDKFWQVLEQGVCTIDQRPSNRWLEYAEELAMLGADKQQIHRGGFIDDVDRFDAGFFRITPKEAEHLDPQQRLLLTQMWRALENAALDPDSLRGEPVGVFLGAYTHDYEMLSLKVQPLSAVGAYFGTGNSLATAAGRIAYHFDFKGPTVTLDTACSSSFSAIHNACTSLNGGNCELALACAANLMLTPVLSVAFADASMLSVDGLCKTFDASADGYVRGEGVAALVLKRLPDALADEDNILAVIKGTALMQDGATNGLTAPNGQAQVEVIRQALKVAAIEPHQVSYVEAHGTGTSLGDSVEMQGLFDAYCAEPRKHKLAIGSVKTNLGHTEAVSGMAGLIKVMLSMRNNRLPPHLHLNQLNPLIRFDENRMVLCAEGQAWPHDEGEKRIAGISSYGFSGSNTHILLEQFEAASWQRTARDDETSALPLLISAKTPEACRQTALQLASYVEAKGDELDLQALSRTLTCGRAKMRYSQAFAYRDKAQLLERLGQSADAQAERSDGNAKPKVVMMFTGQGSQYFHMSRPLYEAVPYFALQLDSLDETVARHSDKGLFEILWGGDKRLVNQTQYAQVALFCVEYAMAEYLKQLGIKADIVLGHSVGEYAAACYAGMMAPEDAVALLCLRGELMQQTEPGEMVAFIASREQVESLLVGADRLGIAACNGPNNQVVSGCPRQLAERVEMAKSQGIKTVNLGVDRAFHSPLMAPVLAPFERFAASIDYKTPQLKLISNVSGEVCREAFNAEYWSQHIMAPVAFEQSIHQMLAMAPDMVIEVGPKPTLTNMAKKIDRSSPTEWLSTLLSADSHALAALLCRYHSLGGKVDWSLYPYTSGRRLGDLPNYPFETQSYWIGLPMDAEQNPGNQPVARTQNVSLDLRQHRILATSVYPAAGYLWQMLGQKNGHLERLEFEQLLNIDRQPEAVLSLRQKDGESAVDVIDNGVARVCARALAGQSFELDGDQFELPQTYSRLDGGAFYRHIHPFGYHYGPAFRLLKEIRYGGNRVKGVINATGAGGDSVLDNCLQLVLSVFIEPVGQPLTGGRMLLPARIAKVSVGGALSGRLTVEAALSETDDGVSANIRVSDEQGEVLCQMAEVIFVALDAHTLRQSLAGEPLKELLHQVSWQPFDGLKFSRLPLSRPVLVLGNDDGRMARIVDALSYAGERAVCTGLSVETVAQAIAEHQSFAATLLVLADDAMNESLLLQALEALQLLNAAQTGRIIALTEQAVEIENGQEPNTTAAALWGLLGAFAAENPGRDVVVVDVEKIDSDSLSKALASVEVTAEYGGDRTRVGGYALRNAQLYARTLTPINGVRVDLSGVSPFGCYLISGGLGGIGKRFAHYLHTSGAERIVLLSRHVDGARTAWVDELNRQRRCIEVIGCDITRAEQVAGLAAKLELPVKGVFHAAGALDDGLFADMNAEKMTTALAAKVHGAINLTRELDLSCAENIWLCSSIVGLYGGAGQANYAAANMALTALAARLRRHNLPASTLHWGAWRDTGMMADNPAVNGIGRRMQVVLIEPKSADEIFNQILACPPGDWLVSRFDTTALNEAAQLPLLLAPLREDDTAQAKEKFNALFEGFLPQEIKANVRDFVAAELAEVARFDAEFVKRTEYFGEMGLDSLMVVDIQIALSECCGEELPATLLFDHPTLNALADHLIGLWRQQHPVPTVAAPPEVAVADDKPLSFDQMLDNLETMADDDLIALLGDDFSDE